MFGWGVKAVLVCFLPWNQFHSIFFSISSIFCSMYLLWSLFRSVPLPVCPQELHDTKTEEDSAPTVQLRGPSTGIDPPTPLNSSAGTRNAMSLGCGDGQAAVGAHSWPVIVAMIALIGMGRTMSSKRTRELN
ncbi:hypothetical protein P168DRAFT_137759 [Aspergillus campestris IBT 28561]|uniref:Uncharacterized protein n=1 Tax=Aspergillus campestris (strain IBT 28561) TaxID=1392248 RepID=A0A2I1D4A2_ASPC2|nr:uncharacterized protein P168DRAFT_137759 [Aspergillus campestris IBT 28561]PKY04707.1 hypothetical protein P168DRAFT_137759 [Aspergillus campestris IBT 28561]